MKPLLQARKRALSCLSLVAILLLFLAPGQVFAKGGGGSHDSESSSSEDLDPEESSSSSSTSSPSGVIIHTGSNACVYQNTNEVVACPKNSWTSTIAVIIATVPVIGAILLIFIVWLVVKQWYIRRERKRNTLGAAKQSAGFYQPIDGHVHPEGAYYASSMSNYSLGEDEEKKIFMPEPVLAQGL